MRKLALAAVLALSSLSGVAHAIGPTHNPGNAAPATPAQIAQYIGSAKVTKIKISTAKNSQYVNFNNAIATKSYAFHQLQIGKQGPDFGKTAYIPMIDMKGIQLHTAYIMEQSIAGPHLVGKVKLPAAPARF